MTNKKLLIVGAGPTGLTAAVELARRGIVADVIDKKEAASTLSRAVGILPRSLDILGPSGVTERLLSEGVKLEKISMYRGTKEVLTFHTKGAHPRWDYGVALAQDRTEAALHDAFANSGGEVRYGVELKSLEQHKNLVSVTTTDGSTSEYTRVLGADGVGSATRKSLGIEFVGFDLPETWSIADVDSSDWANYDRFTMSMLPDGVVVVVAPLERNRFRVISNTEDSLKTLPLPMAVSNVRRAGTFNISIRQVEKYSEGNVFLAGDAAHCHSPAGGRGMNLGIADADEFAERLINGTLDGYSSSRHVDGKRTIELSEQIRKFVITKSSVKKGLLALAFFGINVFPPAKRILARRFLGD